MDMDEARGLFEQYAAGKITEEERALLESWYLQWSAEMPRELSEEEIEQHLFDLTDSLPGLVINKSKNFHWARIAAAIILTVMLSAGWYFQAHQKKGYTGHSALQQPAPLEPDVPPGNQQATLTLANGNKILLKKGLTGVLAKQGNTVIQAKGSEGIAYTDASAGNVPPSYNVLSTVRGEQSPFPLVLADGTKVWLDAESSIRFPSSFVGKERIVEVSGQAYFEVVHDELHPFKVLVKGITINDLGTKFNINAYDNESGIKTTLVEGGIEVRSNSKDAILKPGQQAFVDNGTQAIAVKRVNINTEIAWRQGVFKFDQTDLKTVMRQIARWYDLSVIYQGNVPNDVFQGQISRSMKLSDMLKILQTSDIHFNITANEGGKQLIIKP